MRRGYLRKGTGGKDNGVTNFTVRNVKSYKIFAILFECNSSTTVTS
jgi:hypothetical protein